jgi:glutamyl-tRNA synthetase
LRDALTDVAWETAAIAQAFKQVLGAHGLKMPQLAIPVRLLVCGRAQTPSVDATLCLFDRETVLKRLQVVQ